MAKLTKEQYKELTEALLSAFPTKTALTKMQRRQLAKQINKS